MVEYDTQEKKKDLENNKESSSKIQGVDKYRSKKIGEFGYGRRTIFQKRRVIRKVYGKYII